MRRLALSALFVSAFSLAVACQTQPPHETALANVSKAGGTVTTSKSAPGGPVVSINLSDRDFNDATLAGFENFTDLQKLDLGHTQKFGHATMTDAGMVHLKGLVNLQRLSLANVDVTDVGLVNLQGLVKLRSLNLQGTKVSDAGLEHLKGLTELQTLKLARTQVTDEGVKKLQAALPKCAISH